MHAIVQGTVGLSQETRVPVLALQPCKSPHSSLQYVIWDDSVSLVIGFCGSGDSGNWESWYFLAWRRIWNEGKAFSALLLCFCFKLILTPLEELDQGCCIEYYWLYMCLLHLYTESIQKLVSDFYFLFLRIFYLMWSHSRGVTESAQSKSSVLCAKWDMRTCKA